MKNNFAMWLLPTGILIGLLIGGLIHNTSFGIAIGALLSMIATLIVRFLQNRKRQKRDDDHNI
ncbi:MAG: hypothetical protein Q4A88_02665 [Clostridia bacterium]|nr:hypothetical protein [Clostridia bacterium]